jgi:NhaP-type Na+/H+ or K+/H+ antiporter
LILPSKSIDNYHVEIFITLSLVTGGYALAEALHTSGPISMVVAGLIIGNHGRRFAMSDRTRQNLDTFWELVNQILNSLLFVLMGFEILVITFCRTPISWLVCWPSLLLSLRGSFRSASHCCCRSGKSSAPMP